MSDKSFPDPDASSINLNTEIIKLLTWNVWWKFENYKERENLIISEINNSCPDILCLQEVWEETDESQAKIIADQLGYNYIFEKSFEFDGVAFGNAIITKFPINSHHTLMFKTEAEKDEKRFLLHLSLKYKSEMINVICTRYYDCSTLKYKDGYFLFIIWTIVLNIYTCMYTRFISTHSPLFY